MSTTDSSAPAGQPVGTPQQQSSSLNQQAIPQSSTPVQSVAQSSVGGDSLTCQWSNCGERLGTAEQLYVSATFSFVLHRSTSLSVQASTAEMDKRRRSLGDEVRFKSTLPRVSKAKNHALLTSPRARSGISKPRDRIRHRMLTFDGRIMCVSVTLVARAPTTST